MKTSILQSPTDDNVFGINYLLCLPKAELNTKNSTKRQLCCRLVEFLVFNSIGQLISLPSDEVYRVGDGGPDHAVVLQILIYYLWAWKAGDDLTGEKKGRCYTCDLCLPRENV